MKKRKNFYIVRWFDKNDKCVVAKVITKPNAMNMIEQGYNPVDVYENEAGGITTWFDLTIKK